ncbi:MAG: ShlB/FhaC/HecB family hemolysin secretion/activation protein [Alphaproteobacteria bacterium]|nr:ShlB/FhaC/HecB family hemolysin secretion/activation protein [Alphaproteobacteria bacterium]
MLKVVEGYIGDVRIEGPATDSYLVDILLRRISAQRPLQSQTLESTLLLLNDIPGIAFESVLARMEESAPPGAVRLTLRRRDTKARGSIFFNNFGSRYTGPHRAGFAVEGSFLPHQRSAISGLASVPGGNELRAASATHEIAFLPEFGLKLSVGRTVSEPGYVLNANDLESRALNWGVELVWQAIRRRIHNLSFHLGLEGQNVSADILDAPLSRDRVRALRVSGKYEGLDPLGGINHFLVTLSRGLSGLGASRAGDPYLSRAGAKPDFTRLEAAWQRSQYLGTNWLATGTVTGQIASKPLYSSEEFGFGGPFLGRAYDSAELAGDNGIGGGIELRYTGFAPLYDFEFRPVAFYDIGKIWNIGDGQEDGVSLSSAGIGVNFTHRSGLSGMLSASCPLTKSIDTPVYGNNGNNPRIYFQVEYRF